MMSIDLKIVCKEDMIDIEYQSTHSDDIVCWWQYIWNLV